MLLLAGGYAFLIGPLLGLFWAALPEETLSIFGELPDNVAVLFELFGGGDITTAAGFVQIETFGMMAPAMVMVVTIAIGAGAVAGEEAKRTMGLLLANPISRSRVIAEKTFTMVLYGSIVGLVAFLGTWLGSVLGDQDLDLWGMASICILVTLVGIVGGALALLIGSATGRKSAAVFGAIGVMIAMHVMNALGEIADNPWWQKLSPFYYYLGGDPLNKGMDWSHAATLAAVAAVLIALSFPLFQRRDVREKD
jgi:ABC-2 type transport system permease protein